MRKVQQLALPLKHQGAMNCAPTEDLLRAAWRRSRLEIGFEEAMGLPHFRIALRRVAMVMSRKEGRL